MRLATLGLITGSSILFAQRSNVGHGGWWGSHNFSFGGILMWLLPILLIVILAYFIFQRHDTFNRNDSAETPLDILKKRYAKGEITHEEFERMKEKLNQ